MKNISDEKLIEIYLKGGNEAFEMLVRKFLNPVYGFVFKYVQNQAEAEDVTQETFIKIWKNINKFKPEYKFKTWVFSIAKNTALDYLKKKKNVPFSALDNPEENYKFSDLLEDKALLPLANIEYEESSRELNSYVKKLAPAYRTTLDLRYNEGLKFREIALLLKESVDTVKTRHRRALKYLKKHFNTEPKSGI